MLNSPLKGFLQFLAIIAVIIVAAVTFTARGIKGELSQAADTPSPIAEASLTATATIEPTATENYQGTASALSIEAQRAQLTAQAQEVERRAMYERAEHEARLTLIPAAATSTAEAYSIMVAPTVEHNALVLVFAATATAHALDLAYVTNMRNTVWLIPTLILFCFVFVESIIILRARIEERKTAELQAWVEDEQDEETQPAIPVNGGFAGIDIEKFFTKKPDARPWFKELCRLAARDEYFLSSHWRNQPKGKIEEAHRAQLAIREFFLEWQLCETLPGDKWHLVGDGKQWAEAWSK